MGDIFDKFKDLKVLVIGDIILDKFYFTSVDRLSQEAPIPIAKFVSEEGVLGSAANVAVNVAKMGCETFLIGKIGVDNNGVIVRNLLNERGITLFPIFSSKSTDAKIRIFSEKYNIFRLDFENDSFEDIDRKVVSEVARVIDDVDVVIVSDYQKGVVSSELIKFLNKQNKYVVVDSIPEPNMSFKGFSLFKTNYKKAIEVARRLGLYERFKNTDEDLEKIGFAIREKLGCDVLITRSEKGASYFGERVFHDRIKPLNVVSDVTGAGDTCVAVFSLLNYVDVEKGKALRIMNAAASIAVSHIGTYAPDVFEIKDEIYREERSSILSDRELEVLVLRLKKQKKRIVFVNGFFAEIGRDSVAFLNEAKKGGDILIVGINSDSSVLNGRYKRRKGDDEISRAFVLINLDPVDYVFTYDESEPSKYVKRIKPDVYVVGSNYPKEKVCDFGLVESLGGKVEIVSISDGKRI